MPVSTEQKRRLVIKGAVWSIGSYFMVAIFGSILAQLYAAPPARVPGPLSTYSRQWCATQLHGFKSEIENRFLEQIDSFAHGAKTRARWDAWYGPWEARRANACTACETPEAPPLSLACDNLRRLGEIYAEILTTTATAPEVLRDQIQGAIETYGKP